MLKSGEYPRKIARGRVLGAAPQHRLPIANPLLAQRGRVASRTNACAHRAAPMSSSSKSDHSRAHKAVTKRVKNMTNKREQDAHSLRA